MNWIGLDIGGANIKVARTDGNASSVPFRFWVEHDRLHAVLTEIIRAMLVSGRTRVAATMTAELADCFDSRKIGVERIVDCLEKVCADLNLESPVFAGTDIVFRNALDAKTNWLKTAASNWAMLAKYASRFLPDGNGLIFDMGSTTTDIIPVRSGNVVARGQTDSQRLRQGELVYVGVNRTPVCSVVESLVVGGEQVQIAREFFATVGDAMLLCGFVEEDAEDSDTADGRPRTIENAARRICKMICEDSDDLGLKQARELANQVLIRLEGLLFEGINSLELMPADIVVTGSGVCFAKPMIERLIPTANVFSLGSVTCEKVNRVAPAWAVSILASETVDS